MKKTLGIFIYLFPLLVAFGCSKNTGKSTTDSNDVQPMEELKSIPVSLNAELDAIIAPINNVDIAIAEISALPAKLNIDADAYMSAVKLTIDGGTVELSGDFGASLETNAEAKAEVTAMLTKVQTYVASLKATPEKTAALVASCAKATARVPVLVSAVTAKANAKASNVFNADMAAEGQAELNAVGGVQSDVAASITQIQIQATDLPMLATETIAKFSAAFSGGVGAGTGALADASPTAETEASGSAGTSGEAEGSAKTETP